MRLSKADVLAAREILGHIRHSGKYFAYCVDDGTLIWHENRGPWQRDDFAVQFLAFAEEVSDREKALNALEYFRLCFSIQIDASTKAQRLTVAPLKTKAKAGE